MRAGLGNTFICIMVARREARSFCFVRHVSTRRVLVVEMAVDDAVSVKPFPLF